MMRRIFSPSFFSLLAIVAMSLLSNPSARAQSLGDAARENREKKQADPSATQPKVITNATIPKDPDADSDSVPNDQPTQSGTSPANVESSRKAARQRAVERRAAQQWKQRILAQQNTIANLRLRVDRLKASITFLDPNTAYNPYSAVAQNSYQARQLDRLAQLQQQLNQQRKILEDMQEAARHAGMHTPVYDP